MWQILSLSQIQSLDLLLVAWFLNASVLCLWNLYSAEARHRGRRDHRGDHSTILIYSESCLCINLK